VLWSHMTGFKLAVFTLHSGAIHSLAFNHGAQPLSRASLLHLSVTVACVEPCKDSCGQP
jgi:hypothetical protein